MSRTEPKPRAMESFGRRWSQTTDSPPTCGQRSTAAKRSGCRFRRRHGPGRRRRRFRIDYKIPLKYGIDHASQIRSVPAASSAASLDPTAHVHRPRHGELAKPGPSCCNTPTQWPRTASLSARLPVHSLASATACRHARPHRALLCVPKDAITYPAAASTTWMVPVPFAQGPGPVPHAARGLREAGVL